MTYFKIKNLKPYKRSVPTPSSSSIMVDPMGVVGFSYPKGYESFFRNLEIYDFKVTINDEDKVITIPEVETKEDEKIEEVAKEELTEEKPEEVTKPSEEDLTPDVVKSKLGDLTHEQLKSICESLGVYTSASRISTVVNKILNSGASDEDLVKAYKEVI